ncbi:hypothetical protein TW86_10615 [Halomonas sp. S2151]|uniref:hypothetical protein n=1 Tax=Halomonas sp. S2151 TaxID=579478 RepID=UPI0005FA02A4|nr:hypothetical protein [Halomonas sp. S2151]KJZ14032.1 hypothetical protein TW86_10615 [Halomonas sp. S2151]
MARHIDQILNAAAQRSLSSEELKLLSSYIRNLEQNRMPPEDVLVKRIKELEGKLDDCRQKLRSVDRNEIMD